MESVKTTVEIPIDGWGVDGRTVWVRLGQVRVQVFLDNQVSAMYCPRLLMEVEYAKPIEPPKP